MRDLVPATLTVLLASGCTNAFYFPSRAALGRVPSEAEFVEFSSRDGTKLRGFVLHSPERPARATFVHFHGNAGNVTSHYRRLAWVTRRGYDLIEFDYHGYGASGGKPTPAGLDADAIAAIAFATKSAAADDGGDLVLYGQSLGGAVLLHALSRADTSRVRAVVIESSFHSYQEVAASILWRTPVLFPFTGFAYWFVSDDFAPARFVSAVSPIPLLVIHGDDDPIVDVRFGQTLYDLAKPPKELWVVPGGGHIDAMTALGGVYRDRLVAFIETSARRKSSSAWGSGG